MHIKYQIKVLQDGSLPLKPDGRITPSIEHVCTSTVIWPDNAAIEPCNSLLVDPCFSETGMHEAVKRLDEPGASFEEIGNIFVTHAHYDHCPKFPGNYRIPKWIPLHYGKNGLFEGILEGVRCIPCSGHSPDLIALAFDTKAGECWIVGDAIIDKSWLVEWAYYWPNGYTAEEIVQTWNSVAHIVHEADIIVPGHGIPFKVNSELVENLISNWDKARCSKVCPYVKGLLYQRLNILKGAE